MALFTFCLGLLSAVHCSLYAMVTGSSVDAEIARHASRWTHWLLQSKCKTPQFHTPVFISRIWDHSIL